MVEKKDYDDISHFKGTKDDYLTFKIKFEGYEMEKDCSRATSKDWKDELPTTEEYVEGKKISYANGTRTEGADLTDE